MSVVNINVGVLGHVDSGKTSLVRALSTQLSTAALDKDPQSQQRGITLDLGFSSFRLNLTPSSLKLKQPCLQVTLVDCPGHASLFRTILSGVAIIDSVLLVIDCRKGLQAQTIESLLLASLIAKRNVVVVLTKTDLLPSLGAGKTKAVDKVSQEIRSFMATHFDCLENSDIPVVPVAVGAEKEPQGIQQLIKVLSKHLQVPDRDPSGIFRLAVDHCFAVPGIGTILTGTVLSGALVKGDELEVLPMGIKAKVKTLQVFRQDVNRCAQGDRVGILVNGVDPALVEKAMAVSPAGSLPPVTQVVIRVSRVQFFQGEACKSGAKCHATVGHTTVIATATFFSRLRDVDRNNTDFDPTALYEYVPKLYLNENTQDNVKNGGMSHKTVFALLQFEHAVFCPFKALVVCSRLDLDAKRILCRLAFYGAVECVVGSCDKELKALRAAHGKVVGLYDLCIGRVKSREGIVEKVTMLSNDIKEERGEAFGRDMFSKDVDWTVYQKSVVLFDQAKLLGTIIGPFGKAGKFRIALGSDITATRLKSQLRPAAGEKIVMRFLKLIKLKSPKLKGKMKSLTSTAGKPTTDIPIRSFRQDCRLLYPEAFEQLLAVEQISADVTTLSIETPALSKHVNVIDERTDSARSGLIERLKGETCADGRNPFAIVVGLYDTEQDAKRAVGSRIRCYFDDRNALDEGAIEKPFGKAGKVLVDFQGCGGTRAQVGDKVELC